VQTGLRSVRAVAIDWSGAAAGDGRACIALAEARPGRLELVASGLTREEAIAHLIVTARRAPVVAGIDFSFSFPGWFVRDLGCTDATEVWDLVAAEGERWLRECQPPFWGRGEPPTRPGDSDPARELRATERAHPPAQSVFKLVGAGQVGTGSLRGMPFLQDLRREGFAIWPFDDALAPVAVEIYPRVLRQGKGAAELAADPRVSDTLRAAAIASEHTVDAAFSALALADAWQQLLALRRAPEGDERRLEGQIWVPG
jgi:hypothetical protein